MISRFPKVIETNLGIADQNAAELDHDLICPRARDCAEDSTWVWSENMSMTCPSCDARLTRVGVLRRRYARMIANRAGAGAAI